MNCCAPWWWHWGSGTLGPTWERWFLLKGFNPDRWFGSNCNLLCLIVCSLGHLQKMNISLVLEGLYNNLTRSDLLLCFKGYNWSHHNLKRHCKLGLNWRSPEYEHLCSILGLAFLSFRKSNHMLVPIVSVLVPKIKCV